MSDKNGQIPRNHLVEVEKGLFLTTVTARAYRRVKAAFQDVGKTFNLAGPGSAYRDLETQREFYEAYHGNAALARKWGLNPDSSVAVASPGFSSHGWGDRIDILIDGSDQPNVHSLALLAQYGWVREFGASDPNHFQHRGTAGTEPVSRAWCIANRLFVQPNR